jgi:large subunit ribosomal protein L25
MAQTYELEASARERVGKGSARALRREGKIPAVIYGDKQAPLSIAVNAKEVFLKLHAGGFKTHVAIVKVDGTPIKVLPRDYQLDPVRDTLVHVDFIRVTDSTKLTVNVPVQFINHEVSPGLKRGGVLNVVAHEIKLNVTANAIPEHVVVDLQTADIGDSIHLSAVKLPEGATVAEQGDFTIASVTGSSASQSAGA